MRGWASACGGRKGLAGEGREHIRVHAAEKVLRWEEGFVLVATGSENSKTSVVMWPEGGGKRKGLGS